RTAEGAMDRLHGMRLFVRVAELASFNRAADSLGLPKASVSAAVQQLESHLGTRLLQRTTRRVQLTQDGLACYGRCKDLLADVDEIEPMFQYGAGRRGERQRGDGGQALGLEAVPARVSAAPIPDTIRAL